MAVKLLILPLIVGIGYEFIMYAGKHNNIIVRILSAPGLWVQRLTTKEPTDDMLEIAIISTKCALRDEFVEFMEFFLAEPWKSESAKTAEENSDLETVEATEDLKVDESVASCESEAENNEA